MILAVMEFNGRARWTRVGAIALLLGGITGFHYLAPARLHTWHTIMGHAYLLPIVVASYWFGIAGGIASSIAVGLFYSPHIPAQFMAMEVEKFADLVVYAGIGAVTGFLSERLHRKTEQVMESEEQLRVADRLTTVGELAASVAHEIRNPLGAIKGAVEILEDECPHDHPNTEFLGIIQSEIKRLDRLVEEFLRLTRQAPPRLRPVDLSEVLRSVVFLTSIRARKLRVSLHLQIEGHIAAMADEDLMKQAFLNVILNAIEALDECPDPREVTVHARRGEQGVTITVSDTGKGISEEDRRRIHQPFFTTKERGTGLGLPVTKRIVEGHGGRLVIRRREPRGTEVAVTLPSPAAVAVGAESEAGDG